MISGEIPLDTGQSSSLVTSNFDFPQFEANPKEINRLAAVAAGKLISDPATLGLFITMTGDVKVISQINGDKIAQIQIDSFTDKVFRHIESFDWKGKRNDILDSDGAKAILSYLPKVNDIEAKPRLTATEKIVCELAKGFVKSRFAESGNIDAKGRKVADWRGALETERIFLAAGIESSVDMSVLEKWFDLYLGNYKDIAPVGSLPWHAAFLGLRSSDPVDEKYVRLSCEVDSSMATVANLLGRRDEYVANSSLHEPYSMIFDSQIGVFTDRTSHLNPAFGIPIDNARKSATKKGPVREYLKKVHQEVNIGQVPEATPEMMEVAEKSSRYSDRFSTMMLALQRAYSGLRKPEDLAEIMSTVEPDGKIKFPYDIIFARSNLHEALIELLDPDKKKTELKDIAERIKEKKGSSWSIVPFSGLEGLSGYAVIPADPNFGTAEKVRKVVELLRKYHVHEAWERNAAPYTSALAALEFHCQDVEFVLSRKKYTNKSEIDTYFDSVIGSIISEKGLNVLAENIKLERELPLRFSRMPTSAGDKYDLLTHDDLPGVIKEALIKARRVSMGGGLSFALRFNPDLSIFPNGLEDVAGIINFQNGRVNILFDLKTPDISRINKSIIDNILFHLVERSCCPTTSDLQREIDDITGGENEHLEELTVSIPGHLVHIGVTKTDGTPGLYTKKAEEKMQEALGNTPRITRENLRTMARATGGISLASINEWHKRFDTQDKRNLTWNSGYDYPGSKPIQRSNPERLISSRSVN